MTPLVVSLHDVAPLWESECRTWLGDLRHRNVVATLLVVPRSPEWGASDRAPSLTRWLHDAVEEGNEVALHGWDHRGGTASTSRRRLADRVVARSCGEFGGLSPAVAEHRIRSGLDLLHRAGFAVEGFTPPGWLLGPGGRDAARRAGLTYVTSHLGIDLLASGRRLRSVALCHRPGSPLEGLGAAVVRHGVPAQAVMGIPTRLALHPTDLHRPGLRRATLEALDAALARGAEPVTYIDLVRRSLATEEARTDVRIADR